MKLSAKPTFRYRACGVADVGFRAEGAAARGLATYDAQGRVLEATLCVKRGLESFGEGADAATRERATDLLQKAMRQVRANAGRDAFFDALEGEVTDLAVKYGAVSDGAKLAWQNGGRLLAEAVGA